MPLQTCDGLPIPLTNELAPKDFLWRMDGGIFLNAFSSPSYRASAESDANKLDLARFLNEKMKGPFIVIEGTRAAREILHLVLFHPDDRLACRKELRPKRWREETYDFGSNLAIIELQIAVGFRHQNSAMNSLLQAVAAEMMQTGGSLNRAQVEGIMRKIWEKKPAH